MALVEMNVIIEFLITMFNSAAFAFVPGSRRSAWLKSCRLSPSIPNPENGFDYNESPEELEEKLLSLFGNEARSKSRRSRMPPQSKLPETFGADFENEVNLFNTSSFTFHEKDDKGVLLSEREYLDSKEYVSSDGSLPVFDEDYAKVGESLMSAVGDAYRGYQPTERDNYTIADVKNAKRPDPKATSEELHQLVFKNEDGFKKQSELFRKSLTREEFRKEAWKVRRQQGAFQKLQKQKQEALEDELSRFTKNLGVDQTQEPEAVTCPNCGCTMSRLEIRHYQVEQPEKPVTERLCHVCHGERLMEQMNNPRTLSPPPGSPQPRPNPQQPQQDNSSKRQLMAFKNQVSFLLREVDNYRQKAKLAEEENEQLRATIAELQQNLEQQGNRETWAKMRDPDTGEEFLWNLETDETRYDE